MRGASAKTVPSGLLILLLIVLTGNVGCGRPRNYYYEAVPKLDIPKGTGAIARLREVAQKHVGRPKGTRTVHAYFIVPDAVGSRLRIVPQGMEVQSIEVVDSRVHYRRDGLVTIVLTGEVPAKTPVIEARVEGSELSKDVVATLMLDADEFGLYYDLQGAASLRAAKVAREPKFRGAAKLSVQGTEWPELSALDKVWWTGAYRKGSEWLIVSLPSDTTK